MSNEGSTFRFNIDTRVTEEVIAAAMEGMEAAGEYLRSEAVQQTPVDSGALRASAKVKRENNVVKVEYENIPYATVQHESLGFKHPNGGNAKFLENPFNAGKNEMIAIIQRKINEEI